MGGRKETPPTIIMPEEGAPQAFQTIVPQKSYKDIAESTLRTEKEINRLMGQRYDEVGTPEEIGARKKGVEMQAAASYLASLATGGGVGTGGQTLGQVGPMPIQTDPAKEAAKKIFDDSKKAYEAALEKAKKTPRSFMAETKDPSYAQNPDSMFIPQIVN